MAKFCMRCGKKLQYENAEICPNCGAPVTPPQVAAVSQPKSNNAIIIIVIVAAVFIGIILISAVIGAFVFGMAGNVAQSKVVAATAQHTGTSITVTFLGGQDSSQLTSYDVIIDNTNVLSKTSPTIGKASIFYGPYTGTSNHVLVIGDFNDGSQQVILDKYL